MAEKKNKINTPKEAKITGAEKKQRRLFKKRRAGIVLTEDQVKEIKAGRKKLRRDMKEQGITSKKEFELTASSLGLYFDKNRLTALFGWFLWGKGLWILLGSTGLLLLALFGMSTITQMRGHFTINMTNDLFREGFVISETRDFKNPTSHLFSTPAENVPCISISSIPGDVDNYDGQHNGNYFAYTYYIRNEGENTVAYTWELLLSSESKNLSEAAWVMIFEDGVMSFYAKVNENGEREALPAKDDNTRGYLSPPFRDVAKDPIDQYDIVRESGNLTYWRVIPKPFVSGTVVANGLMTEVEPMEVHKYTVVIWLEGDDPDCTAEMVGGHLGFEMNMGLVEE